MGSFQETAARKTAENTVKHCDGGVGSVVANHRGGCESLVVVTTLELTKLMLAENCCIQFSKLSLALTVLFPILLMFAYIGPEQRQLDGERFVKISKTDTEWRRRSCCSAAYVKC